jgi:transcriptional regulator with XRE-family HTH domain
MSAMRLFGQLAEARREQRLTRVAIAARIGVSAAAVGQWEAGASSPGIDTLVRWAHALGRDITVANSAPGLAAWAHALPVDVVSADGSLAELMGGES